MTRSDELIVGERHSCQVCSQYGLCGYSETIEAMPINATAQENESALWTVGDMVDTGSTWTRSEGTPTNGADAHKIDCDADGER